MEYSDKLFEKAANWWFDRFIGPQLKDNGDRSNAGFVTGAMWGQVADKHPVYEEDRAKFVNVFTVYSRQTLAQEGVDRVNFSSDYGPNSHLKEVMRKVGIDSSRAPWKTDMHIGDTFEGYGCEISAGYGAPWTLLWGPDGEVVTERIMVQYTYVVDSWTSATGTEFPAKSEIKTREFYHEDKVEEFFRSALRSQELYGKETFGFLNSSYEKVETQWQEVLVEGEWVRKS